MAGSDFSEWLLGAQRTTYKIEVEIFNAYKSVYYASCIVRQLIKNLLLLFSFLLYCWINNYWLLALFLCVVCLGRRGGEVLQSLRFTSFCASFSYHLFFPCRRAVGITLTVCYPRIAFHVTAFLKEALSVLMLCVPVFIFLSSSSVLLGGCPRCGLSIWLSLLAIFNTLFCVYANFFHENAEITRKRLQVGHFRTIPKWPPTATRRAKH